MHEQDLNERFKNIDQLNFKLYLFVGLAFVINGFLWISYKQGMANLKQVAFLVGMMLLIRRYITVGRVRAFLIGCFALLSSMPAMLSQQGGNLLARHYIILTALCMITLYFDKRLTKVFIVFINVLFVFYLYFVPNVILINSEYTLGHMVSLWIYLNLCTLIFYICTKWGNDLIDTVNLKTQQLKDYAYSLEEKIRRKSADLVIANHALEEQNNHLKISLHHIKENQDKLLLYEKERANIQLVTAIAHEFNTPLGVCITMTSFLEAQLTALENLVDGPTSKKTIEEALDDIMSNLDLMMVSELKLQKLINRVLVVEQPAVIELKSAVQLLDVAKASIHGLSIDESFMAHIAVEIPNDILISRNIEEVSRILSELISNAYEHACNGLAKGEVHIGATLHQGVLEVIVEDNGPPLEEAIQRRLFEPFFTTSRGDAHVGLGLNTVYKLVQDMLKGTIHFEQRSTMKAFIMRLPYSRLSGGELDD